MKVTSKTTLVTGSDEGPVEHKPGTPVDLPKKDAEDLIARGLATASGKAPAEPEPAPSGPVNVNEATVEELTPVDGLGQEKAEAIVAYREQHGPFKSIEKTDDDDGLTPISGIGESTAKKLADKLTV
jgi:competence protein ComEA